MPFDRSDAARQLGITLDAARWKALDRYVDLLCRWNARFNLISRRDVARIWPRHVLDSLSILPILATRRCRSERCRAIDIGTGAGLPGLPLAVAEPSTDWLLVDRNARKIRFLELVVSELALGNVEVIGLDLDEPPPEALVASADVIVSRAMAEPAVLIERANTMLASGGAFVLMTGARGAAAADRALPGGFQVTGVQTLHIPGLDRAHEVTIIQQGAGGRAERRR